MLILGIDSSGKTASVALLSDGIILAEYTTNLGLTHSQTLLPMVAEIFARTGLETEALDGIAVSAGPGSFTGLRIGAATAKGIAMAHRIPMVEVSTLEALAYNAAESGAVVRPIMDARRQQVYTAAYVEGRLMGAEEALGIEELIERINGGTDPAMGTAADRDDQMQLFLGDGVAVYRDYIDTHICVPHRYAKPGNLLQRASSVALLGARKLAEGLGRPSEAFALSYIRKPQAEREREEQGLHVYDIAHERK